MELIVDRGRKEIAIVGTWLAFVVALCLAGPQPPSLVYVLIGSAVGAILIIIGFFAGSRCRLRPVRQFSQRLKLTALALVFGLVLGLVLLCALWFLMRFEPALQTRFASRLTEPAWRPLALAFESSILEEVTFRLFAMTILIWLASRWLSTGASFAIGLIGSALLFGLAHLPAWTSASHPTFLLYGLVLLLNGVGGLLLGWVYWRWGLPYAIFCHFAGDIIVQGLGPHLLV